jgi:hypothetical protein
MLRVASSCFVVSRVGHRQNTLSFIVISLISSERSRSVPGLQPSGIWLSSTNCMYV